MQGEFFLLKNVQTQIRPFRRETNKPTCTQALYLLLESKMTIFQDEIKEDIVDLLTLEDATDLVLQLAKDDPISVIRGFQACNYDCDMKSMGTVGGSEDSFTTWSIKEDLALVNVVNDTCLRFNQKYQDIQSCEFLWEVCEMNAYDRSILEKKSEENIRSRICFLIALNNVVWSEIVPLIDFDSKQVLAKELSAIKKLFFTSWKMSLLDMIIDGTVQKNEDQLGVTVTVNPIDDLAKSNENLSSTWFFQSYQILCETNSSNFCTQMPHSDDPQFPILVKMVGEEVQGNSGSFRQFLARIIEEIHGTTLPLFMPYMCNGPFKGMYQVQPGPLNILTEKLFVYFGQLLGMAVRSGIPLPIGMMPHFWKVLVDGDNVITDSYLASYDPDLHQYLQEIQSLPCQDSFATFLEQNQFPSFVWQSIAGEEVELIKGGRDILLDFNNRLDYVHSIKAFRRNELECKEKVNCILAGLYTILPMGYIRGVFTSKEFQTKVCGSSDIDLHLLKKHTMYQVGISQDDRHIQDFWAVLFSLTPEQLTTFIKFACNQERIPKPRDANCLPPPYPMKIAPADAREEAQDNLLIRAETCIFMVKIPRYSSYDIMREKILYSIQSAEDPLSG